MPEVCLPEQGVYNNHRLRATLVAACAGSRPKLADLCGPGTCA